MRSLYEIANEYKSLLNELMESEDITAEQLQLLDQQACNVEQKVVNVAAFIKNLEVEKEAINKAIDEMERRHNKVSKKLDQLKDYLKQNMEMCNLKEVKSPYFDVKVKENPPSVTIKDESLVPKEYIKEIIVHKIDKTAISEKLKLDIAIPGTLLEKKTRIEIR